MAEQDVAKTVPAEMPADSSGAGKVRVHVDDLVFVMLDDGKVNAVDLAMARDLRGALGTAVSRGLPFVVAGRPGVFSAGFDLAMVRSEDPTVLPELLEETKQLVLELLAAPVPVVVACTGHALAAGALLLLAADHRSGPQSDVRIGLNEVALGMALPDLALSLAADRLSSAHLHRTTVLGRACSPTEALATGFLDELHEDPVSAALEAARALGGLDRAAFGITKRLAAASLLARLQNQTLAAPASLPQVGALPEATS